MQQRMPMDTVLTVSYIGNGSRQMIWTIDINGAPAPGPGTVK
jgi:hypothetical protein